MNQPLLGVMQGRLLPKYQGRYQAHPVGYWQREFSLAAQLGLDLIEFILDFDQADRNPLMRADGLGEIQALSNQTGVGVKSVCADYFMEAPLHGKADASIRESQKTLNTLIINSACIGISDIVIPCVDQSSLQSDADLRRFTRHIQPAVELAGKVGVNLALETDLASGPLTTLIKQLDSPRITVNYDSGNRAALGCDPGEELAVYGVYVSDIHIKDRMCRGVSVELGTGDTDFDALFASLAKLDYRGILTLQAYRDSEGVRVFKRQLDWFKSKLARWTTDKGCL